MTTPNPNQISGTQKPQISYSISHDETHTTKNIPYFVNDEIPGLKELLQLAPLIVPHRLRHDHSHKKPTETSTSLYVSDINGLEDDEDYSQVSKIDRLDSSSSIPTTTNAIEYNETTTAESKPSKMSPEDERILAFFGSFFDSNGDDIDNNSKRFIKTR